MFMIRLSPTFSADNAVFDIDLPQVPAPGDTIATVASGGDPVVYEVIARQFVIEFDTKGSQILGEGIRQPKALLHVKEV